MARLSRRLQTLESRIIPDRPKLIFIVPYVDPSEPLSGIAATVCGITYSYAGSSLDEMLGRAEAEITDSIAGLICELISVDVSTATKG